MGQEIMVENPPEHTSLVKSLSQANTLRHRANYQDALEIYLALVERMPGSSELFELISECYFGVGLRNPNESGENYVQAILWLEQAAAQQPVTSRYYKSMGDVLALGLLDYERASEAYRAAIKLNAQDHLARFGGASLVGVPEQVVSLQEAIQWMEEAVQLEPDHPEYYARLAVLYLEAQRKSEAIQTWTRALLCTKSLDLDAFSSVESQFLTLG